MAGKDEKFISSLNPADKQILLAPLEILPFVLVSLVFLTGLAAKYFKDGWESRFIHSQKPLSEIKFTMLNQ